MKPVLYLDVDGVLWDLRPDASHLVSTTDNAKGANGLREFLDLAFEHFEVRWCTCWAMSGIMRPEGRETLEKYTGISFSEWAQIRPSLGFSKFKHETIDADEHRAGRPFVWVEDGLMPQEHQWLRGNHWSDRYFHTDVFEDADALVKTTARLRDWLAAQPA